jgi:hypothetical protein
MMLTKIVYKLPDGYYFPKVWKLLSDEKFDRTNGHSNIVQC